VEKPPAALLDGSLPVVFVFLVFLVFLVPIPIPIPIPIPFRLFLVGLLMIAMMVASVW
jgi:hypothetical protein